MCEHGCSRALRQPASRPPTVKAPSNVVPNPPPTDGGNGSPRTCTLSFVFSPLRVVENGEPPAGVTWAEPDSESPISVRLRTTLAYLAFEPDHVPLSDVASRHAKLPSTRSTILTARERSMFSLRYPKCCLNSAIEPATICLS